MSPQICKADESTDVEIQSHLVSNPGQLYLLNIPSMKLQDSTGNNKSGTTNAGMEYLILNAKFILKQNTTEIPRQKVINPLIF
jgi:hypothetical protein